MPYMWEILNSLRENKKKKNWHPCYDELFSTLAVNDVDKSIVPYIELLKTSDFKKAIKTLNVSWNHFEINGRIKESFMKFVDYLLENERYKEFYRQSMERYKVSWDNKEIYEKVYNTTLSELGLILSRIKNWTHNISPFSVSQVIKVLRGDAFIFKLGDWLIWFEKDYLYWDEARKINEDGTDKPVYGYRMHVWERARIYSLKSVFKDMWTFLKNVDTWANPYVWMKSWLLDMDFLKYRLKRKGDTDEEIKEVIDRCYWCLWEIKSESIGVSSYERIREHVKKHNTKDPGLLDCYEKEWHKVREWKCLINLIELIEHM